MREASPGLVEELLCECLRGQDLLLERLSDGRVTMNEGCEKARSAVAHLRHLSRNNMNAETTPNIFALLMHIAITPPEAALPESNTSTALTWEEWARLSLEKYTKQTELFYRLIETTVGNGHSVDVPGYVRDHFQGDWDKAVSFICSLIRGR